MKAKGFRVDDVVMSDPAQVRSRHPNSEYEFFYKICISIPIMISFSLVFFMIFYISPRGETMQLFQKGIYEWNKERLGDHMASLQFEYSVTPTAVSSINGVEFELQHSTEDESNVSATNILQKQKDEQESEDSFQDEIRSIYFYSKSYFSAPLANGVLDPINFTDKPADSTKFCIDTLWKSKNDRSILAGNFEKFGQSPFSDVDDQPSCGDDPSGITDDVGLSFVQYKFEPNTNFVCSLNFLACQAQCLALSGVYNYEDGQCYELNALQKICIMVDLSYLGNLPPMEAEVIDNVKIKQGCYVDGEVGLYETVPLTEQKDGSFLVMFKGIPVEVRHYKDPYTVFTAMDKNAETADLSIFFWLSMVCLLTSMVLIFYLGVYYHFYISSE